MNSTTHQPILSHIVATAHNGVIGAENDMPWHLPQDLKKFKERTQNHVVIMGRKTYESIGKPLPKRLNIVISRTPQSSNSHENLLWTNSVDSALALAKSHGEAYQASKEIFIIGGEQIYRSTFAMVDRIYLTKIEKDVAGDTYYPEIPDDDFCKTFEQEFSEPEKFSWWRYDRQTSDPGANVPS